MSFKQGDALLDHPVSQYPGRLSQWQGPALPRLARSGMDRRQEAAKQIDDTLRSLSVDVMLLNALLVIAVATCFPRIWSLFTQVACCAYLGALALKKHLNVPSVTELAAWVAHVCSVGLVCLAMYALYFGFWCLAMWAVSWTIPSVRIALLDRFFANWFSYLPSDHVYLAAALLLRVAVLADLLLHSREYRDEVARQHRKSQTPAMYLVDMVYSFGYGCAATVCLFACFRWQWQLVEWLMPPHFQGNLTIYVAVFCLRLVVPSQMYVWSAQYYVIHSLLHRPAFYYAFHAEHHSATNQTALLGNGAGLLEMFLEATRSNVTLFPTALPYSVLLLKTFAFNSISMFDHHYFAVSNQGMYHGALVCCAKVLSLIRTLDTAIPVASRLSPIFRTSERIWTYPGRQDWGPHEQSHHARHHWTTEKFTFDFGFYDLVDEVTDNK